MLRAMTAAICATLPADVQVVALADWGLSGSGLARLARASG
ncbi:MAG: hypothetical protein ACHQ4H_14740 [Ktedonobacterales bacterium]